MILPSRAIVLITLIWPLLAGAQNNPNLKTKAFPWRNIGPANQGGRIVDIEARNDDFTDVYIGVASGGVWKSKNAGTTWEPIFDRYETASIGDIAIDQNLPGTIWVGTGEANNRNSTSWGHGVYRSSDDGEHFELMGLENTHHIARVLIHPQKSEEVCVCATGHLWGRSGERGIFKTSDNGKSWMMLQGGLPNDGKAGCIDMLQDPQNPQVLYAAMYDRLRRPWHFTSGGEQGGIYRSKNGGRTWTKLTNGLPKGPTGRIGLALYHKNPKVLMALVEAEKSDTLSVPGSGVYRSEDGGDSWSYINTYNNRPFYYSQIRINPHNDQRVYLLTTTFMVSDDGGKTIRNGSPDYEVHGDYHAQWFDPLHADRYYLGADKGLSITHDHGQHFTLLDNLPIAQFYRIGLDHQDPYYVYGGLQDNGMYATASFARDARGILNDHNWKLHWGDGMYVAINPFDWREVYTSAENGTYYDYDPLSHDIDRISPSQENTINHTRNMPVRFNWEGPMQMSAHDPSTLYVAGNYLYKSIDKGQHWTIISPDLSTADTIKSKRGMSGGITPDNTGAETHCAITTVSESNIDGDIIWVGTDDGLVHVTQDGGESWHTVRSHIPDVPDGIWVSRIEASHVEPGRAYVSFDGHRSDVFTPWIFTTDDYGRSWEKITNGISPKEVIRVVREDLKNPNLLFAGTETGIWYSLDRGKGWHRFMEEFPVVSVYDLKIHPRDHDLVAGTHGRSIWIADDISPLQQWSEAIADKSIHLFEQRISTIWKNVSRGGQRGHFLFMGENPPSIENSSSLPRAQFDNLAVVTYYCGTESTDSVDLVILDEDGHTAFRTKVDGTPGIHRYYWNREFNADKYSQEEYDFIDRLFRDLTSHYSSGTLRRLYASFKSADSGNAQRRAVTPLRTGFLSLPIPDKYLLPIAKAGSYKIQLSRGELVEKNVLVIREDPMVGQ